jgi:hypothetical protein
MINTGITIKLYELSELSPKAKQKAIEEHRNFELSIMNLGSKTRVLHIINKDWVTNPYLNS